jgi:hypothetical protein
MVSAPISKGFELVLVFAIFVSGEKNVDADGNTLTITDWPWPMMVQDFSQSAFIPSDLRSSAFQLSLFHPADIPVLQHP